MSKSSIQSDRMKKQMMDLANKLNSKCDFIDGIALGALLASDRNKAEMIVQMFTKMVDIDQESDSENEQSKYKLFNYSYRILIGTKSMTRTPEKSSIKKRDLKEKKKQTETIQMGKANLALPFLCNSESSSMPDNTEGIAAFKRENLPVIDSFENDQVSSNQLPPIEKPKSAYEKCVVCKTGKRKPLELDD